MEKGKFYFTGDIKSFSTYNKGVVAPSSLPLSFCSQDAFHDLPDEFRVVLWKIPELWETTAIAMIIKVVFSSLIQS